MKRISIVYPRKEGSHFDMAYYVEKHMPRAIALLSVHPGFRGVSVERGISGAMPGTQPSYVAMCHYLFESEHDFMEAFLPHAAELQGDISNYTDIEPVIQVNEVMITR